MFVAVFRTVLIYFFLVFIMRLMGKRQIGQLQPSELIITMLISEIATTPIEDEEISLFFAFVPILGHLVTFFGKLVKTGKVLQKANAKFGSYSKLETIVNFGKIW